MHPIDSNNLVMVRFYYYVLLEIVIVVVTDELKHYISSHIAQVGSGVIMFPCGMTDIAIKNNDRRIAQAIQDSI